MQNRLAHQIDQLLKDVLASPLGRIQHCGQSGIGAWPPFGAGDAHHFAMDNRRVPSPLVGVIVGRDIRAMQEHKQMASMRAQAFERRPSLRGESLDHRSLGGQFLPVIVQMDGAVE